MKKNNIKYSEKEILEATNKKIIYLEFWGEGIHPYFWGGDWIAIGKYECKGVVLFNIYRNYYGSCGLLDCPSGGPLAILNDAFAKYGDDKLVFMNRIYKPYLTISAELMRDLVNRRELHQLFPCNLRYDKFKYRDLERFYADNIDYDLLTSELYKLFNDQSVYENN